MKNRTDPPISCAKSAVGRLVMTDEDVPQGMSADGVEMDAEETYNS